MIHKLHFFILLFLIITLSACENTEFSEKSVGILSGAITTVSGEPILSVYIFEGDSLLNISKESNNFSIELQYGDHELTLSAIGYADSTISYYVHGDSNIEISLDANNDIGRVYGEFQDLFKFQQNISENNDIANWTEKQVFDSVTGATILEDNSTTNFEQAQLFIGDSLFGYADVYGQYWIKIQCGTYPLTGSSEEFSNETKIVKVLPNTKVYMNFFLNHE